VIRQIAAENESAREWESSGLKGASVRVHAAMKGPRRSSTVMPISHFRSLLSAAQFRYQRFPTLKRDVVQAAQNKYVKRDGDGRQRKKQQRRDP